jgi:membrane fusion protein (multidrug efflux system)
VKLLSLILLVLITACSDSKQEVEAQARVTSVVVAQPQQRDIDDVLTALGSVESINDPTVSAQASGQVEQIVVREGDRVETGQLLAALDSTLHAIESAKAAAEVRRYGVLVDNQDSEVKRLQRLTESQSVSRDKLEDEQAQLEMLSAQRDIARKQWEQHQYMESKTRIVAPLDGLVTRRHISPGDYVTAGQPLFDLVSVDRLRARIAFPEQDAAKIAVGKEVHLTTPTAPGVMAIGEVAAVNPQIKVHNRAVEISVEFNNPGGWLPGASTDATLVVERREQALTVPLMAIVTRDGREVVFVVDGNQVRAMPVTPGWREGGWVEIVSGITATDQIVIEGAALLSNGSRIEVDASAL